MGSNMNSTVRVASHIPLCSLTKGRGDVPGEIAMNDESNSLQCLKTTLSKAGPRKEMPMAASNVTREKRASSGPDLDLWKT